MIEKENVLRILKETLTALKSENYSYIKELSNQTIHSASTQQDSTSITLAVFLYSLSKILERTEYKKEKGYKTFNKDLLNYLSSAIDSLEKNDLNNFDYSLKKIRRELSGLSGNLKDYIQDVFRKAEINKASKIYEHGISMEQTAKLLGVSIWELANYTGQKTFLYNEPESNTLGVKKRIKLAEDFFK